MTLLRGAFAHVARHALLYAGLAGAAIAIEWTVYHETSAPAALFTSGIFIDAVLATIVFAQTKGDIDGAPAGQVWLRVLDRTWAVIIVDFITTYVGMVGLASLGAGDLAGRIIAIPILLIAAATVFSEAIATVVDGEQWWFLVVHAIGGSVRASLRGATLWRAIVLFALELVPVAVSTFIANAAPQNHGTTASFWSDVPFEVVYSIPLDALVVLAFFDASGYEPKRACDE